MKKIFFLTAFILAIFSYFYFSYPKLLRKVVKAEKAQIVLDIKNIDLKKFKNPINSSIEVYGNDFLLTYRINEKDSSYIGLSVLDENFKEKYFKKIDVKSTKAEDPRIFKHKENFYLVYNDVLPIRHHCRVMHIAKLDNNFDVEFKKALDLHIKPVEKNWVPFTSNNDIYFAYGLVPHKILQLEKPNQLKHLIFDNNPCFSRFFWDYGEPRGGTPAKLVDGEYLAFFHSCFGNNKKKKFYVMGAYTYQKEKPFKITKVSKFPIIFGENKKTRIFFPAGFVIKKVNGKDLIYLSYGENDNNSKIVVIDKEKLFENMKEVY